MIGLAKIALQLLADVLYFAIVALRPSRIIVAENLKLFESLHSRVRLWPTPWRRTPYGRWLPPLDHE